MKKTISAVALFLVSASLFAQVNVATKNLPQQEKVISQKLSEMYTPQTKKVVTKAVAEGATLLTSFSSGTYTTGTTSRHTGNGDYAKWLNMTATGTWSTNDPNSQCWIATQFLGLNSSWSLLDSSIYCNMSGSDGFAYVDFWSIYSVDHQNNTVFDAWIQPNQTIKTYGKRGIDIYFSQFVYRFNSDRYYVEWSHDEDFSTKDSMEFNVRNVDVATNDYAMGTTRVTLPTNTSNCPLISTDPDEDTYIRIRVCCPASQYQPHGYLFIIDDLAWAETPENRLDVLECQFYGGYRGLPEIVTAEPLYMQLRVNNSGSNDIYNVHAQNMMVKGEVIEGGAFDGSDSVAFDFENGSVTINEGTQDTLAYLAYETTGYADFTTDQVTVVRDYEYLQAYDANQLNEGVGRYAAKNKVQYTIGDPTTGETQLVDASPYDYYYVVRSADTVIDRDGENVSVYHWNRDCGATALPYRFADGQIMSSGQVYTTTDADVNAQGYRVCLGFNAREFASDVYPWGVSIVPAVDSTSYVVASNKNVAAGATIKSSLWFYDIEAEDANSMISQVLNDEGDPIESNAYVVQNSDLNTVSYGDGTYTYYSPITDLNSIYLPFATIAPKLETDKIYYACYEQVTNGTFSIARDYPYTNIFKPGYSWINVVDENGQEGLAYMYNVVIWSPNVTSGQYPWGYYFAPDYNPMIRLVIADAQANPSGLNDVVENNASMSLFPNPAKDNTVLDYTLSTTGNVTIDVTDLMGRVVLSYNEGLRQAGIANKANIEAKKLANGTYFCTVNVNGAKASTTKMVVNR